MGRRLSGMCSGMILSSLIKRNEGRLGNSTNHCLSAWMSTSMSLRYMNTEFVWKAVFITHRMIEIMLSSRFRGLKVTMISQMRSRRRMKERRRRSWWITSLMTLTR